VGCSEGKCTFVKNTSSRNTYIATKGQKWCGQQIRDESFNLDIDFIAEYSSNGYNEGKREVILAKNLQETTFANEKEVRENGYCKTSRLL